MLLPKYGLLAEYDLNGKPLRSWHDPVGKIVECTTQATIFNNKIYIGSFYNEKQEQLRGWKQYRLRGMATHPDHRSKGLGSKLMRFAMDHLNNQKADLLWCNARENALEFYKRLGFAIEGPPFDVPGIGEHFLMYRKLP